MIAEHQKDWFCKHLDFGSLENPPNRITLGLLWCHPVPRAAYKPQHCLHSSPPKSPCLLPGVLTRGVTDQQLPPRSLPESQPALISRLKRIFWCLVSPHLYTFYLYLEPALYPQPSLGTLALCLPALCHHLKYLRTQREALELSPISPFCLLAATSPTSTSVLGQFSQSITPCRLPAQKSGVSLFPSKLNPNLLAWSSVFFLAILPSSSP